MQYLLTAEEYSSLLSRATKGDRAPSTEALQKLCTLVADNVPVVGGWYDGKVWGCILTDKDEHYCDDCPAKDICPYPYKNWSK